VIPGLPLPLADALERMTDAFVALDREWRYLYVNAHAAQLMGLAPADVLGKVIWTVFPDTARFRPTLERAVETQQPAALEVYYEPWGRWVEGRCFPSPEGLAIFFSDVTERKRAEEARSEADARLRETQRLEAVGQLAGGVAHDFNNVLAVVLSYAELVLDELPPDHPSRADVGEIRRAAERGAVLTRQLLAFGRQQVLRPRSVDLNAALGDLERMLRRLLPAEIALHVVPSRVPVRAHVDPAQLQHALMHLVLNARDAMPQGGVVSVEPGLRAVDAGDASGVGPGRYATLTVRDSGTGMDAPTRARAFEPFFTTKPPGEGAGLGLPMVHGFAAQSGGAALLDSAPGQGTQVTLYLPLATAEAPTAERPPPPLPAPGGATVLVVEDEVNVRRSIVRILERQGIRVIEARHGADALLAFDAAGGAVDAVITDLVMPELGGVELVARLRERRPDLPVVVVSGYAGTGGKAIPGARHLEKPFEAAALVREVTEALARAPA
jgi:PAS domain S-box-containing protein